MPVVPLVHQNATLRAALRRGLNSWGLRLVACRSAEQLLALMDRELVDAIVIQQRRDSLETALALAARYPRIPVFVCGTFRPDDGVLLSACRRNGIRDILVDGVDDQAAAELVARCSGTAVRRQTLRDAPRLLRLSEPLQVRAWDHVLARVDGRLSTADVARSLNVTREHLSREFAAGGAPNLKRVIDLARVLCAADLLQNPGYNVAAAARVLGYSSPSHLAGCARRIADAKPEELPRLGLRGVFGRFLRGRTRSRI